MWKIPTMLSFFFASLTVSFFSPLLSSSHQELEKTSVHDVSTGDGTKKGGNHSGNVRGHDSQPIRSQELQATSRWVEFQSAYSTSEWLSPETERFPSAIVFVLFCLSICLFVGRIKQKLLV